MFKRINLCISKSSPANFFENQSIYRTADHYNDIFIYLYQISIHEIHVFEPWIDITLQGMIVAVNGG